MEQSEYTVITITSKEDVDNYMKEYKGFLLEINESSMKDKDFIEFKDYATDKLHIKKIKKGMYNLLEKHQQYAFQLKTGTIFTAVDNDGKLIATKI